MCTMMIFMEIIEMMLMIMRKIMIMIMNMISNMIIMMNIDCQGTRFMFTLTLGLGPQIGLTTISHNS